MRTARPTSVDLLATGMYSEIDRRMIDYAWDYFIKHGTRPLMRIAAKVAALPYKKARAKIERFIAADIWPGKHSDFEAALLEAARELVAVQNLPRGTSPNLDTLAARLGCSRDRVHRTRKAMYARGDWPYPKLQRGRKKGIPNGAKK